MFGLERVASDWFDALTTSPFSKGRGRSGGRNSSRRGRQFYNVGANQKRANTPKKSNWGYRKSPKNKYISDAMEATKYSDPTKYRF